MATKWGHNDNNNKYDSRERRGIKTARTTTARARTMTARTTTARTMTAKTMTARKMMARTMMAKKMTARTARAITKTTVLYHKHRGVLILRNEFCTSSSGTTNFRN